MDSKIVEIISQRLGLQLFQVENTIALLDDGATIPFISRYRKERTGSLDEVVIGDISDNYTKLNELLKRRETVIKSIEEQGVLTPELKKRIEWCFDASELEDIYLPYKPKRRTRAQVAREKGLEGLARLIMKQQVREVGVQAERFLNNDVNTIEEALQGARDIMAEWISENEVSRKIARRSFEKAATLTSKVVKAKESEATLYRDYFDFSESLRKIPSHRLLAIRRGEKEGFLRVNIGPDDASALHHLDKYFLTNQNDATEQVAMAIDDAWKRLLKPAVETEFASISKEKADEEAINVFASNLRQLLLAAPLGPHRTLAIDPGFRTGCKVVCLDEHGSLLHNETIYPHPPQNEVSQAMRKISSLIEMFKIEAIAIGNGTAGRETEDFIRKMRFDRELKVFVVNEAGASIYSASKVGRDEFPQYDVTVRGSVSIGRRLMDPLAELVKLDPKTIGVGQYQHDVDQSRLKVSLDRVVESCVNMVGVNLNTASQHLLAYVSGIGPKMAENIVKFRNESGGFKNRTELKKVSGLGAKTFEQAAGFLRIPESDNILDHSAVHPESYPVVQSIALDLNTTVEMLVKDKSLRDKIVPEKYVTSKAGLPTILDIVAELEKPGRDPRQAAKTFEFDKNVRKIDDLHVGMVLPGIVNNVTKFGAFVDIGIKENGMVHISELADRFISDPTEIVSLHQHVQVRIISIDFERKRIALSMKNL